VDDARGPTIGGEMAAALDAEARRQASGPPPSPLLTDRYQPDELRLLDPHPSALDDTLRDHLRAYQARSPADRARFRDAVSTRAISDVA